MRRVSLVMRSGCGGASFRVALVGAYADDGVPMALVLLAIEDSSAASCTCRGGGHPPEAPPGRRMHPSPWPSPQDVYGLPRTEDRGDPSRTGLQHHRAGTERHACPFCRVQHVERQRAQATSWMPLRVRPDLCLPADSADSLLPGHKPAHDARWAAVGKRDMSTPFSEMITCAARSPIPGIVHRRLICWAKGARTRSISVSSSSIMDVRWSMCSRCIRASSPR